MEMKPTDVCTARGYYFFTTLYMALKCEREGIDACVSISLIKTTK
jgi:hypothetical protein